MDFKVADDKKNRSGEEARHGGGVLRWVWITGLVLILYVLSVGPAVKLEENGIIKAETRRFLYAPVRYLNGVSRPFARCFLWYVGRVWRAEPWASVSDSRLPLSAATLFW
jgi:hypothetical protein